MQSAEERDPTAAALHRLIRALRRTSSSGGEGAIATMTPEMFRTTVSERLRSLERELTEVRTRINGLLFVVTGAVITQLILRLM